MEHANTPRKQNADFTSCSSRWYVQQPLVTINGSISIVYQRQKWYHINRLAYRSYATGCKIMCSSKLYVWLTVHLELYSYNEPIRCAFFYFISLPRFYMFRAILSPSSGGQVYNVAMVLLLLFKRLSAGPSRRIVLVHYTSSILLALVCPSQRDIASKNRMISAVIRHSASAYWDVPPN
jgi:hypothetical protein